MQSYTVKLESEVSNSFRCAMAAQSLDIDVKKKSIHELKINADIQSDFSIGLIVGASGSGKTTLAKQIFGQKIFEKYKLDETKSILDQLPKELQYEECAEILSGIGLTSVPCWIRPVYTLSNGQKARAEAALYMQQKDLIILDEWTSVVDRTVAKVMSHCVQKTARKNQKKIILLSCHYDVIEWLNPDWIIDCNTQSFIDRRLLRPEERKRKEQLKFDIREGNKNTWKYFSKYHYLSDKLACGKQYFYGLYKNEEQIGFLAFSNYIPKRKNHDSMILHSNRLVIHPDYTGLGIGIKFVDSCSDILLKKGYKIRAKFSSQPMYKSRIKNPKWRLINISRQIGDYKNLKKSFGRAANTNSFRKNIKTYTFEYIG